MKVKQKLDKILDIAGGKVEEEVSSLIGADIKLTEFVNQIVSKEEYFLNLSGKKILAKIDLSGEIEGKGCLVVDVKDAIRLGGILIMLPQSELEEVVKGENYTDETEDSYGEIANIITGAFTKVFEENYSKNFRFVRKEQELVNPLKIEGEGNEPILDQYYYLIRGRFTINGEDSGNMDFLIPALPFGLDVPVSQNVETDVADDHKAEVEEVSSPVDTNAGEGEQERAVSAVHDEVKKQKQLPGKQKLDKILEIACGRVEEEVSALIGNDVKLSDFDNQIISKEEYFLGLSGKKILARMDISGEIEGQGCLVVDAKDAIRLGGIMIMLPQSELDEIIKEENYTEETEDSYGEIANIIAGSFTKVFEENYSQKFRFVRKEQEVVNPVKIEGEGDEPILNQYYYLVRGQFAINGEKSGKMDFLLPAEAFGLEVPQAQTAEYTASDTEMIGSADNKTFAAATRKPVEEGIESEPPAGTDEAIKKKKLLDKLLNESCQIYSKEVGALLGVDVKLSNPVNSFVDKERFFYDEVSGKQVVANLQIVDDLQGTGYLVVSLKDAIRFGSILIMLPPSEMETAVNEEDFSADNEDAYGEIANIIAGAYTAVFQEQYEKSIRFVKEALETVSPMKVDVESDDVIPRQNYYMNRCELEIDGVACGHMHMLLPAELFELGALLKNGTADNHANADKAQDNEAEIDSGDGLRKAGGISPVVSVEGPYDVLIIQNDQIEAGKISTEIENAGVKTRMISYNDPIRPYVNDRLRLVFIVMENIDEQAFSIIIKVNTLSSVPIVATGAMWTRSKVIKAVKYGVQDILLTPANTVDIMEKLNTNMLQMAA